MERPVHQPDYLREQSHSFDVLASVDLYRFDLMTVGHVRPETRQRVCDEELSYIAEGINRPLQTEFTLHEINSQLALFEQGQWRPYIATLMRGLETAKQEAAVDPRKTFMVERATKDLA